LKTLSFQGAFFFASASIFAGNLRIFSKNAGKKQKTSGSANITF